MILLFLHDFYRSTKKAPRGFDKDGAHAGLPMLANWDLFKRGQLTCASVTICKAV